MRQPELPHFALVYNRKTERIDAVLLAWVDDLVKAKTHDLIAREFDPVPMEDWTPHSNPRRYTTNDED